MTLGLCNANPVVHAKKERVARAEVAHCGDDAVDALDVFDILSASPHLLFSGSCRSSCCYHARPLKGKGLLSRIRVWCMAF